MKPRKTVLLVLGMMSWPGLHAQQVARASFSVSAMVEETCDLAAPDRTRRTATAPLLRATCTPSATYLARSPIPGNPAGMVTVVVGVGTGKPVDHALFSGNPATQIIPPGDYNDAVSVRVYY